MKTVYQAAHSVEAHMLSDLLKQEGIEAHVRGAHLQSVMGDLPGAGLVRLEVDEADYARARAFVERWDAEQTPSAEAKRDQIPPPRSKLLTGLLLGLALGVGGSWVYFKSPSKVSGVDYNHDGRLDERWTYTPSGMAIKIELDRNLDDKVDYVSHFDDQGLIESADADDNFDGVFETHMRFRLGNVEEADVDTDGDGFVDMRTHFDHGVPASTDYFNPATGLPLRIEYYKLGKLTHAEVDTDRDGKLDTRIEYTPLHEISSTRRM